MVFTAIPEHVSLDQYRPPTIKIECLRCRRYVPDVQIPTLRKRFGNIPVIEAARRVAASGPKPCGLARDDGKLCSVRAFEPPVWHWANLYDALHGKWQAALFCHRHLEALKRAEPCPGNVPLDIPTLLAALGHDFKLERLPSKCECPKCHTSMVEIAWHVPDPVAPPHAPADEGAPVLRLRPSRGQAQRTLRVIRGG